MTRIRQRLPDAHITDVPKETRQRLLAAGLRAYIKAGARIAITAGSRGMGGFTDLVAGIINAVKAYGGEPYIVRAMGSHGGATAEGQTEILRRLGVTEATVHAPIRATMATHALGASSTGAVAQLNDLAAAYDGIIVLGRTQSYLETKKARLRGC